MKKKLTFLFIILLLLIISFSIYKIVINTKPFKNYELPSISIEEDITNTNNSDNVYNEFCENLRIENNDFKGWISIEGTNISYPLMKSDTTDFYLKRDFYKNYSKYGTPYMGNNCDFLSDNIIIYGHNMEDTTMFSDLLLYSNEQFFKDHPTILIQTVNDNIEYNIVAVFKEKVHYQDEKDVFRYYNYVGDLSKEDYETYIKKIKEISLYDTNINATYNEQLITLSTCSYHTENGRFVVVAVKNSN